MNLISHEIGIRKDNSYELERYIYSLFKLVESTAKVLYPSPSFENREEIMTLIKCIQKAQISDFDTFKAIWLCSKKRADEICLNNIPAGISYMDIVEYLCMLNVEKHGDGNVSNESKNVSIIRLMYDSFIFNIEAALLENSIKYDLFYYQDKFGLFMIDEISDISISASNGWPIKTVRTFATQLGHRIEFSSKDKLEDFHHYPFSKHLLGDISDVPNPNEESEVIPLSRGKCKCKHAAERLNSVTANKIYDTLQKRGYTKNRPTNIALWVKNKELYAYFCYKITDRLISTEHQIETKYISQSHIAFDGNISTVSKYATDYRRRKKEFPSGHKDIDNIIDAGLKNQL